MKFDEFIPASVSQRARDITPFIAMGCLGNGPGYGAIGGNDHPS